MNEPVTQHKQEKLKLASAALCGCFGCHMSLLDIDERLFDLVELVTLDRSPLTDIKTISDVDIGLIEGGVANTENVEVLRDFRRHCNILVAVGACAVNGGIPSMRNQFDIKECLQEVYIDGIGVENPQVPDDPEIPLLLDRVHPIHEVVQVDYFLPGCPPSADTIWTFINELIEKQAITLPYSLLHYD